MHIQADRLGLAVRIVDGVQDNPNELTIVGHNDGRVSLGIEDRDSGNAELWITVTRDELLAALAVTAAPLVSVEAPDGGYYTATPTPSTQQDAA